MEKIVIGFVGEMASGKDTAAIFLEQNYHSSTVSFSKPLRDILDILGLPQTRKNLVWLGEDLRKRYGDDILARAIAGSVKKQDTPIVCVPNIRLPGDLTYLVDLPNFYLVAIESNEKVRFKRLSQRTENADDQTKTWEEFQKDSKLPTEVKIKELMKTAQLTIINNSCLTNLNKQVVKIIKTITGE